MILYVVAVLVSIVVMAVLAGLPEHTDRQSDWQRESDR